MSRSKKFKPHSYTTSRNANLFKQELQRRFPNHIWTVTVHPSNIKRWVACYFKPNGDRVYAGKLDNWKPNAKI